MLRPLLALVALALPVAPAHAATEEYGLTPSCRIVGVPFVDNGRMDYVVVGTAAAKSTVSVATSTTIHCRVYDASGLAWSSDVTTPGTYSALVGDASSTPDATVCGWAEATFLDGQYVATQPCP